MAFVALKGCRNKAQMELTFESTWSGLPSLDGPFQKVLLAPASAPAAGDSRRELAKSIMDAKTKAFEVLFRYLPIEIFS